ncbi:MAG: efflux RND transporter periplasmic adaptor subunit [Gammaproteobacteria bacterium]
MLKFIKALLPVLLLSLGGVAFWWLNTTVPTAPKRPHIGRTPVISVQEVSPRDLRIPIYTRGLVSANAEVTLVAEAGGRVMRVASALRAGGQVTEGQLLVQIDDSSLQHDIARVKGRLAAARQQFDTVKNEIDAEADVEGLRSPQQFLKNKLKQAKGQLDAAKAELELARLQLQKTKIFAPFDGLVRESYVVEGQVIPPGFRVAGLYDSKARHVRLPLSDRQFRMIETESIRSARQQPRVMLRMRYGEDYFYWRGRIIAMEGGIDPRNHLRYVVAQIDGPLEKNPTFMPDLWVGQLLEAEIEGRQYRNVVSIPRDVLRFGDLVWLVDGQGRLSKQTVSVLHKGKGVVYLSAGLRSGDRVVTTPMDLAVEGMRVVVEGQGEYKTDMVADDVQVTGRGLPRSQVPSTQYGGFQRDYLDANRDTATQQPAERRNPPLPGESSAMDPNVRYHIEGGGTRKPGSVSQALDRGEGPSEVPIYSTPNMMQESFE